MKIYFEWVQYEDYRQIHMNNRILFKDIKNFRWMIKNKQYNLLKCKLLNENEEIEDITINSLEDIKFEEFEKSNLIEIFQILLLSKKYDNVSLLLLLLSILNYNQINIQDFKLIFQVINENEINNLECLNYIIKEFNSSNLVIKLLELLIKSNNEISNQFKNQSIQIAFKNKNKFEKGEIIKYILKNKEFYSIPLIENDKIHFNECLKLDTSFTDIQNQLIELNYFKQIDNESFRNDYGITINEEINDLIYDRVLSPGSTSRIKELYKILSKKYKDLFYFEYILKFREIIDNNGSIEYLYLATFKTMDINLLKLLITNSNESSLKSIATSQTNFEINNPPNSNNNLDQLYEFIKLYTSNEIHSKLSNKRIDKEILNIIISNSNNSNETYQEILLKSFDDHNNCLFKDEFILKSYNNSFLNNNYNIQDDIDEILYNSDQSVGALIKDKETIDWLIENLKFKYLKKIILKLFKKDLFQFNNYKLSEYFNNQINQDVVVVPKELKNQLSKFYLYPYIKAIYECDIKSLEYLDTVNIKFSSDTKFFEKYKFNEYSKLPSLSNQDNIRNLINYFNETRFSNFTDYLFQNFIKIVVFELKNDDDDEMISINLNYFIDQVIYLISESINKIQPKLLKFLLSNLFENQDNNEIDLFSNKNYETFKCFLPNYFDHPIYDKFNNYINQNSNYNSNQVIECIELVLKYMNSNDGGKSSKNKKELCSRILNLLFSSLIVVKGVTINQVLYIQKLIVIENGLKIPQFPLLTIYYLNLKSPSLARYVMSRPFIKELVSRKSKFDYQFLHYPLSNSFNDGGSNYFGYDLKYLNFKIFSFDFIFNNSFDIILEKLIKCLSIDPANDNQMVNYNGIQDYFEKTLNADLKYFLDIKRLDLFFKHLQLIQNYLSNLEFHVGRFPLISFDKSTFISKRKLVLSKKLKRCATKILNKEQFELFISSCEFEF